MLVKRFLCRFARFLFCLRARPGELRKAQCREIDKERADGVTRGQRPQLFREFLARLRLFHVDEINEDGYPVTGSALQYLREHFHLAYDEDRYFVTYEAFAPNIIPTIYVTERGAKLP